ncbi:MAG: type II toxin-antitoxin system Phd/YefM family antitoxin [Akkermansiaceae bacterium]|jgi:antitoxin YefM|nr:type II toxin-antitoxin system Phd/YefM family antitoxin [Akkermansiaceae bacterium]MDP4646203.1 type II toxin-antitoxin system Phd/YefM family antitoxin [Akkermansiaceae bacterium]MDP4720649.1 type II toxin-antitoxin system Phd/YefM family antitoxin [Akkermansiaceae bacterium]MDP4779101.1 type II toxin-antitoxin system Phd/YefM family antitoxin [Akkermansiaceae bacterium]MDP4848246.1 type II toxin-antitoxin system Phd/YefM family antitoxin [Akkermansiaceae bacterium]
MKTVSATSARSDLYRLIDSTLGDHEPVQITGKRGNAVLVAESDWRSIQETLYLLGVPGMRESIVAGMKERLEDCSESIDL